MFLDRNILVCEQVKTTHGIVNVLIKVGIQSRVSSIQNCIDEYNKTAKNPIELMAVNPDPTIVTWTVKTLKLSHWLLDEIKKQRQLHAQGKECSYQIWTKPTAEELRASEVAGWCEDDCVQHEVMQENPDDFGFEEDDDDNDDEEEDEDVPLATGKRAGMQKEMPAVVLKKSRTEQDIVLEKMEEQNKLFQALFNKMESKNNLATRLTEEHMHSSETIARLQIDIAGLTKDNTGYKTELVTIKEECGKKDEVIEKQKTELLNKMHEIVTLQASKDAEIAAFQIAKDAEIKQIQTVKDAEIKQIQAVAQAQVIVEKRFHAETKREVAKLKSEVADLKKDKEKLEKMNGETIILHQLVWKLHPNWVYSNNELMELGQKIKASFHRLMGFNTPFTPHEYQNGEKFCRTYCQRDILLLTAVVKEYFNLN